MDGWMDGWMDGLQDNCIQLRSTPLLTLLASPRGYEQGNGVQERVQNAAKTKPNGQGKIIGGRLLVLSNNGFLFHGLFPLPVNDNVDSITHHIAMLHLNSMPSVTSK
jgi:hypothetical protein